MDLEKLLSLINDFSAAELSAEFPASSCNLTLQSGCSDWSRGLDSVYIVNDTRDMPTIVQSCRIEADDAALLTRQAKRRHLEVSTLSSLYLKEKALEEEFPGIGFRDSVGGREAYVQGHRVAVWEVEEVNHQTKTITKTADHFRWPPALVRCALAYAKAFPKDMARQRQAEVGA